MLTKSLGLREQYQRFGNVQNLMVRVDSNALLAEHEKQEYGKAKGVDGEDKSSYGLEAHKNVVDLERRLKDMKYRPQPVRRTYIPKF